MTWTFEPPGNVSDFRNPAAWHRYMSDVSDEIILNLVAELKDKTINAVTKDDIKELRPQLGYADPTEEPPPSSAEVVNIQAWGGFPRSVERRDWSAITDNEIDLNDPDGRYRAVDIIGDEDHRPGIFVDRAGRRLELPVRHRQDEYLEWAVAGDGRSVVFVTEGYDYFAALYREDEQAVVDLYREFLKDRRICADDLRATDGIYRITDDRERLTVAEPGAFNPRNILNIIPGIVHLSHRANSLGAEVFLAGQSALARAKADGSMLSGDDAEELMCCNLGGEPNRNSDPIISQAGYRVVLAQHRYTLANPVGLYVAGVEHGSLLLPNNRDPVPEDWWHSLRGDGLGDAETSRVLRLELRIPNSETVNGRALLLSDLKINGGPLAYPGQLAELIKVHLFVTHWERLGGGTGPVARCRGTCCKDPGSPILRPTRRPCQAPRVDAFDGLISGGAQGLLMAGGDARVGPGMGGGNRS